MYTCEKCNKSFEKRHAYIGHCSVHYRIKKEKIKLQIKHICKYCGKEYETGPLLGNHIRSCSKHPNREERIKKIIAPHLGKPLSTQHKNKVSNGMKLAHKEGRAWNIGKSRWNNEPSYPETFFKKVIENEFEDKNYTFEYPVGIYSLDFAWIKKKKVIEIDGDQHQRFEEYKERDKRKDVFLLENGWQILRISWKDMYNNTKEEIQKCKNFIK
jgi:very-short-patch-repair endonuclease